MIPGRWTRDVETSSEGDSTLQSRKLEAAPYEHVYELTMGTVISAEPEPGFVRVSTICESEAGYRKSQVAWPGPNVVVGLSGTADGSREEIHGFYDAPLEGQAVLIGHVGGRLGSPIVVNKYSSKIDMRPHLAGLNDLPLTSQQHDYRDVLIGSFTGSLIALRGGVPIPGQIVIRAAADVEITARAGIVLESAANIVLESTVNIELDSKASVVISAAGPIEAESEATATVIGNTSTDLGPTPRQPALLGNDVKNWLGDLLTAIKAITVTCSVAGAPSVPPVLNAAAFTALDGRLDDLLSGNVNVGE